MNETHLNSEQIEAINSKHNRNLVIASAGTGKTSTIVGRIAYLLRNGVLPKNILLLTFTNKSATEMLNRVSTLFPDEVPYIMAGTFHGVSYKILKTLHEDIILKQPSELKTIFKSSYESNMPMDRDEAYASNTLFDYYSYYLNSNLSYSFGDFLIKNKKSTDKFIDDYEKVVIEFNKLKKEYKYVGFDDLLMQACDDFNLTNFNFEEVLVDEYQDTNPLQNKFINTVTSKSLFCVGDYDQSIYSFNGSDISIINGFKEAYEDAIIFTLNKNYRSTKSILDLADRVISHNERIYPKNLKVVRQDKDIPPALIAYDDLFEQYQDIAKRIHQTPTPTNDIGVIFRNNSSADGIEISLKELGISVRRKGGISFFDTREIKIVFDLLSLVTNSKDLVSFINVMSFAKGIGNALAKNIFDACMKLGDNLYYAFIKPKHINPFADVEKNLFGDSLMFNSKDVSQAHKAIANNPILQHPKINNNNIEFVNHLCSFFIETHNIYKPDVLIDTICKTDLFLDIKNTIAKSRALNTSGGINEDIKKSALIKIDEKTNLLKNISSHYKSVSHFINAMIVSGNEIGAKNGVNLLTIHSSKGLEFEEVYIIDLMQGRFPNDKLLSKNSGSIDEERRLFYVAVTRAKTILYLSYAKNYRLKKIEYNPSIFLKEAKLVE